MSIVAYRCPFCRSKAEPAPRRIKTPLGNLVAVVVLVAFTIPGIVGGVVWTAVGTEESTPGAVAWRACLGIPIMMAAVLLGLGADRICSTWAKVCPRCKMRVN